MWYADDYGIQMTVAMVDSFMTTSWETLNHPTKLLLNSNYVATEKLWDNKYLFLKIVLEDICCVVTDN